MTRAAVKTGKRRKQAVSVEEQIRAAMTSLKRAGSAKGRDQMRTRFGITGATADTAYGVAMRDLQVLARKLGTSHELALALWDWEGGQYEARLLASFVDRPESVSSAQMDRWCADFDNWGVCDTVCFKLFDRVSLPVVFRKISKWSRAKGEFQKRAAFALLASLALHHRPRDADEATFLECLHLTEAAATDDRNFVKKGVSWALRSMASRGPGLRKAVRITATRMAETDNAAARWTGKDVLRQLKG